MSFIPIENTAYSDVIAAVIAMIKSSGLKYVVGGMSTLVTGNQEKVMALVSQITSEMFAVCGYRFDVKFSNVCACDL